MKLQSIITEGAELLMELGGRNPRPPEWHLQHADINKKRATRYEGKRAEWAKRLVAEHELMAHRNSIAGLIAEGRKLQKRWSWSEVGTGRVGQSEEVEPRKPRSLTALLKTADRVNQWAEKAKGWKTPGAKAPTDRRVIAAQLHKRLRDRMKEASA